jgi:hypothetical protein
MRKTVAMKRGEAMRIGGRARIATSSENKGAKNLCAAGATSPLTRRATSFELRNGYEAALFLAQTRRQIALANVRLIVAPTMKQPLRQTIAETEKYSLAPAQAEGSSRLPRRKQIELGPCKVFFKVRRKLTSNLRRATRRSAAPRAGPIGRQKSCHPSRAERKFDRFPRPRRSSTLRAVNEPFLAHKPRASLSRNLVGRGDEPL